MIKMMTSSFVTKIFAEILEKLKKFQIHSYNSQVYLSLFGFSVFAFTLDICFYFKNTR